MRRASAGLLARSREQGVQAARLQFGLQRGAGVRVAALREGQALQECREVEARAAHHQGSAPTRQDVRHGRFCRADVLRHVVVLVGVGHVDQVVRDAALLCRVRFGRPDVQAPVHEEGVGGHDLHVARLHGQRDGQARLAGRGGGRQDLDRGGGGIGGHGVTVAPRGGRAPGAFVT